MLKKYEKVNIENHLFLNTTSVKMSFMQAFDSKKQNPMLSVQKLKTQSLRFVGSFHPVVSKMIEEQGFDGVYLSGSLLSADRGLTDTGVNDLQAIVKRSQELTKLSLLPSLVDADTGFESPAKTLSTLESGGFSGLHIEDQNSDKRCGHLDNKQLISIDDMCLKIQESFQARKNKNFLIIARTDAFGVEGKEQALERAQAYLEAGADMIFPEALKNTKNFEEFRDKLDCPLLANMTEFGKTDIITYETFKKIGYNIIIYPCSSLRLALGAVETGLQTLYDDKQKDLIADMQKRSRFYELLNYKSDFKLKSED